MKESDLARGMTEGGCSRKNAATCAVHGNSGERACKTGNDHNAFFHLATTSAYRGVSLGRLSHSPGRDVEEISY